MMKKIIFLVSMAIIAVFGVIALPSSTQAEGLSTKLKGRVLLAVQTNGETWYVNPVNEQRYFLGNSADALNMIKQLGLGISNSDFNAFNGHAPARLSGRILLKVQGLGEAYYVNPLDLKMNFLGNPQQALNIMQSFALGINNSDLAKFSLPQNLNVSITNSGFSPATLTVNKGAIITWTNFTTGAQTVSSPNNFNFGEIASGKTYSRQFNIAGTYNYHSLNQTSMTGTIIVK